MRIRQIWRHTFLPWIVDQFIEGNFTDGEGLIERNQVHNLDVKTMCVFPPSFWIHRHNAQRYFMGAGEDPLSN